MNLLNNEIIHCPYCGERIEVLIDASELPQSYIEDCQVCCRPINFQLDDDMMGGYYLSVSHENES